MSSNAIYNLLHPLRVLTVWNWTKWLCHLDDWPITRQYVTPPPPSKIWIRPCSNHWEKEKSGASTCLKASFECGIEGWSNGCQPENSKAPPHPQTQTGSPGKQDRNRQSRETVRPPPAINKPMQGLLFTWRNPFVHIFFLFYFYWYLIQPCLACPPHELTLQIARGKHVVPLQGSHLLHVVICIYIFSYCHRYIRNAEKIPHLPPPSSTSPPPQTSTQIQKMAMSPKT